jgi:hypothetical protein
MARKINEKLITRMTQGDLALLLNHIKSENENLRLEVRKGGKAFVYYKKCKILDLGYNSYGIDEKYFDNAQRPADIKDRVINSPEQYFKDTMSIVDNWLAKHSKEEFELQQNIATDNQKISDRYIILDMEYNFSQSDVEATNRVKKAGFDLLGIERETGKVVFFEVKKGLNSLTGKAGINTHIKDFEECLYGKNKAVFQKNLIIDIENIVSNKKQLGLMDNFNLPVNLSCDDTELIFVFEPVDCEKDDYYKIFKKEHGQSGSKRQYQTIFVSPTSLKLL